jgi:hypothetical protein
MLPYQDPCVWGSKLCVFLMGWGLICSRFPYVGLGSIFGLFYLDLICCTWDSINVHVTVVYSFLLQGSNALLHFRFSHFKSMVLQIQYMVDALYFSIPICFLAKLNPSFSQDQGILLQQHE